MFKIQSEDYFPKVLLLDEIDATLHPSMIKNLLNVIQQTLLQKGTKVILVTHSPTTIALSPENSIFIVNKDGPNRIEKSDKGNAIDILTEGIATLDKGLKLFDQVSRNELSIITEGNNVDYIKKAISFFIEDKEDKIDVISGFENRTGKNQLKTLFDFFTLAKPTNKVLFVWDSDFTSNFEEKNNTYGFVFTSNTSSTVEKNTGIENLFDDEYTKQYLIKHTDAEGNTVRTTFNGSKKQEFKKEILGSNNKIAFKNFGLLCDYVEKLFTQ